VELRLPGLRQHIAPQPHVLLVGEAGHRRRVAVDGKLQGAAASDVEMLNSRLRLTSDPSRVVRVSEVMQRHGLAEITETFEARPSEEREKYVTLAHGAPFVEVKGDPDLGTVRVTRALEVTARGTIINPKASHSQEKGLLDFCAKKAILPACEMIRMDQINVAFERMEKSDVRYCFVIDMRMLEG
jgi:hypothetical protein